MQPRWPRKDAAGDSGRGEVSAYIDGGTVAGMEEVARCLIFKEKDDLLVLCRG